MDLWRQLLQRILHPRPLWSKTACIGTAGEDHHLSTSSLSPSSSWLFFITVMIMMMSRWLWWQWTIEWQVLVFSISARRGLMAMLDFLIRLIILTFFIWMMILMMRELMATLDFSTRLIILTLFIWMMIILVSILGGRHPWNLCHLDDDKFICGCKYDHHRWWRCDG